MAHQDKDDQRDPSAGPIGLHDSVPGIFGDEPAAGQPGSEKFVSFYLNDRHFAVPSAEISEVIRPLPVTPLPGSPPWFLGLANFRGEFLGVLNLKAMWNDERPASSEKSKLIVFRSQSAKTQFAIKVDKMSEIVTIPVTDIHPASEEAFPHIYGTADRASGPLHLVDASRLLESLAFD